MDEFITAALGFPTVLFTAALMVVLGFWLLVLCGAADHDGFDSDLDGGALGLGGVPVTLSASLLIALAWFTNLYGSALLARTGWPSALVHFLGTVLLFGSLLLSWRVTRLVVRPLAKLFPDEPGPSRLDFVGLTCAIRTGRVDAGFGQAEVTAGDGATAIVQVRQHGSDPLTLGSTALLYAYDDAGEFFWVAPFDAALDPRG
ncbi:MULTISPECIES: hypothetical protein [unclassified Streptomyces]|uniref:hypothetical protein n=1 Tax=unclassified Streptomyces TaxID=2593676 RepID=UPI0022557555|nr:MULTISPECIES: hypothetical protein [unclassified Streptomyces]MCX5123537.1 hypothetical protein [Streptomyces sp. NBC_00347]MCX5405630.1 hypothetical protein [Streptomyces sp. NBC_00086]